MRRGIPRPSSKPRELADAGIEAREAAFATERALGNVALARDRARDVWVSPWVQGISQDLRFALRLLVKDRRVTLVAVIALALGIASTNTIFTIVNAMVWRGLPVERPDRVVAFTTIDGAPMTVSFREVEDWRAATTTFAGIATYSTTGPIAMRLDDESDSPDVFFGAYVAAGAFRLLGEKPILGRDFVAEDDRPGAPSVVLLGHTIWVRRYGGEAAQVVWLFVRRSIAPVAIGLVIGIGGALGAGALVRSLLVDTGAADPLMLVSIAMLFMLVATAACFIPARRAARLDPVTALRQE